MKPTPAILTLGTALLLLGCEESMDPEPAPVAEAPADPTATETLQSTGGGGSALGGARNAAENTVDRLESRQNDIIREIEDMDDD